MTTAAEALATIKGLAGANKIRFTAHALQRSSQRGGSFAHVRCALMGASSCQAADAAWRVEGKDLDGDDLTMVIVIEDAVVIITLF